MSFAFSVCQLFHATPAASLFSFLDPYLPQWMNAPAYGFAGLTCAQWLGLAGAVVVAIVAGIVLQLIVVSISRIVVRRTEISWDNDVVEALPGPLRLLLIILIFSQLVKSLDLSSDAEAVIGTLLACILIFTIAWFLLRLLKVVTEVTEHYYISGQELTPQARAIHTQISVVRTIARFLLMIAAVALALMQFEVARTIGVSMLASAGVAGVVLGFAARSTVASLFAGIQVAFTQTIRIGDIVVVEGEFGTVEDIKLTYVVVKIWDLRRLILPVTYFTEKPFQNWTTSTANVMGTVFVYTDYSVSIDDIRAELKRMLAETDLWDGQVQGVVVTNLTQSGVEVRILVSADNSGKLWDLRCLIREKMLTWLQSRGEQVLPAQRIKAKPLADGREESNLISPPMQRDDKGGK